MTTITPEPDSRLEQLAAQYDETKAAADAAAERFKAITDGIKAELAAQMSGAEQIDLTCWALRKPLRLQARTSWRVDAKRLKAEDPETYVRYAKQSTSWVLAAVRG